MVELRFDPGLSESKTVFVFSATINSLNALYEWHILPVMEMSKSIKPETLPPMKRIADNKRNICEVLNDTSKCYRSLEEEEEDGSNHSSTTY